jgi:RNA recognition motif-containing protein
MNIYVGNLAYSATEEGLQAEFEQFGAVASVKIITDKFTGQSRGFGFVEMPNREEGDNAIKNLNGKEVGGRALRINESRPKTEGGFAPRGDRPPRGGGDRGGYGGDRGGRY